MSSGAANKELTTFADRITSYDVGGSIGGPIVRDKVWFFGAYRTDSPYQLPRRQIEDGDRDRYAGRKFDRDSNVYAGKLTWTPQLEPHARLLGFGDPTSRNGWLAGSTTGNTTPNADETSALRTIDGGGHNYGVRYTGVLASNWLLDVSVGQHRRSARHRSGDRRRPQHPAPDRRDLRAVRARRLQRGCRTTRRAAPRLPRSMTNLIGTHELRYGARRGDQRLRLRDAGDVVSVLRTAVRVRRLRHLHPGAELHAGGQGFDRRARRSSRRTAGARRQTSPSISGCATRTSGSTRRTTSRLAANQTPRRAWSNLECRTVEGSS